MIKMPIPEDKLALGKVQKQFETWRNTRKRRGRIPEALWEAATNLSEDYSLGRISTTLGLNYKEFKKRVVLQDN